MVIEPETEHEALQILKDGGWYISRDGTLHNGKVEVTPATRTAARYLCSEWDYEWS